MLGSTAWGAFPHTVIGIKNMMRDFDDSMVIEDPTCNTKLRKIDLRSLKHWLIYSCRYMS